MIDLRNIELKTVTKTITSNTAGKNIGGQVPAAMKRWVTFVSIDNVYSAAGASQLGVYFASVPASDAVKSSLIATANRKLLVHLRGTQSLGFRKGPVQVPKVPNIDTPLFSIAAEKWLGVYASKTTGIVTVQYFDE